MRNILCTLSLRDNQPWVCASCMSCIPLTSKACRPFFQIVWTHVLLTHGSRLDWTYSEAVDISRKVSGLVLTAVYFLRIKITTWFFPQLMSASPAGAIMWLCEEMPFQLKTVVKSGLLIRESRTLFVLLTWSGIISAKSSSGSQQRSSWTCSSTRPIDCPTNWISWWRAYCIKCVYLDN